MFGLPPRRSYNCRRRCYRSRSPRRLPERRASPFRRPSSRRSERPHRRFGPRRRSNWPDCSIRRARAVGPSVHRAALDMHGEGPAGNLAAVAEHGHGRNYIVSGRERGRIDAKGVWRAASLCHDAAETCQLDLRHRAVTGRGGQADRCRRWPSVTLPPMKLIERP